MCKKGEQFYGNDCMSTLWRTGIRKSNGVRFKTIGDTRQGMATSDVNRFTRLWYEVDCCNIGWNYSKLDSTEDGVHTWYPYIKGGTFRKWYGNEDYLVNWKFNGKEVKEYAAKLYKSYSRTIKNISEYLKPCISWGMVTTNMGDLFFFCQYKWWNDSAWNKGTQRFFYS